MCFSAVRDACICTLRMQYQLLQRRGKIRFPAHAQGSSKWRCKDMRVLNRKQLQISDELFFPIDHTAHNLLPQISVFWNPESSICGKMFGSNGEVIEEVKKWLRVQNSNCYKKGIDAIFFRWRKAVDFYVKNEVCNTSIYLRYVNVTSIISKITSK